MADMLRMMAVGGPQGGPMTPNYARQASGQRHYVGRKLDVTKGVKFNDIEIVRGPNGQAQHIEVERRHAVFVPHPDEVVFEYPLNGEHAAEYLKHLRDGDLIPADEFTAGEGARLGVSPINGHKCKFDPEFARSLHKLHLESGDDTEAELAKSAEVLESVKSAIGQAPSR
jgi:hypothetical protein